MSAGTTVEAGTETLFLSDLENCRPQSALSVPGDIGTWRVIPYRNEDFAGTMLLAAHETHAPEVTYPLNVTSWHRISIGVYVERWDEVEAFQVKLSDEKGFSVITVPTGPTTVFYDVY